MIVASKVTIRRALTWTIMMVLMRLLRTMESSCVRTVAMYWMRLALVCRGLEVYLVFY